MKETKNWIWGVLRAISFEFSVIGNWNEKTRNAKPLFVYFNFLAGLLALFLKRFSKSHYLKWFMCNADAFQSYPSRLSSFFFPIKRGFTIEKFPAATVSLFSPGRLFFSFQLGKGRAMALVEMPSRLQLLLKRESFKRLCRIGRLVPRSSSRKSEKIHLFECLKFKSNSC